MDNLQGIKSHATTLRLVHTKHELLICAFSSLDYCTLFSSIEKLYCTFSYSLARFFLLNWQIGNDSILSFNKYSFSKLHFV